MNVSSKLKICLLILFLCAGCNISYIEPVSIPKTEPELSEFIALYEIKVERAEHAIEIAEGRVERAREYDSQHWGTHQLANAEFLLRHELHALETCEEALAIARARQKILQGKE